MTLIGAGQASPVTFLFNRPIRALLPQTNREPFNVNADEENCEPLKSQQDKYLRGNDTCKFSISFPIVSTVAMQREAGGPWMLDVIVEGNSADHNGWLCIVRMTKICRLITHNTRHIWKTPIMREQYL